MEKKFAGVLSYGRRIIVVIQIPSNKIEGNEKAHVGAFCLQTSAIY